MSAADTAATGRDVPDSEGVPQVVYVTGRDKSQKQLNGKSANLNFCLQQIYPDEKDPEAPNELKKIPVNELMCLFDADQTCSRGFFMTMLRYIDSGDDVGVALSPQLMYNVIPDCDVFNHQNVHFWEMMQPGMDALGFISLTGTNMILRSRALQQAGWFPMNSVTEDWALGMRFKKLGYRCRYVNVRFPLRASLYWRLGCILVSLVTGEAGFRVELSFSTVQDSCSSAPGCCRVACAGDGVNVHVCLVVSSGCGRCPITHGSHLVRLSPRDQKRRWEYQVRARCSIRGQSSTAVGCFGS